MKNTFAGADEIIQPLFESSQRHMDSCEGLVLPFDTYCIMAVLRGIDCVNAYGALVEIDNFVGCSIISRAQLDSLARLHGVAREPDPHALAQRLIEGKQLRDIKSSKGRRLTDGHLMEQLSELNPWVSPVYRMLNESAHLSSLHYKSLLAQALHKPDGVMTVRYVGDSSYVQAKDKEGLNRIFATITKGLGTFLDSWRSRRTEHPATVVWKAKAAGAA